MTTSLNILFKKNMSMTLKKVPLRQRNLGCSRCCYSSLQEAMTVTPRLDLTDDYVARQFGYRVVPSLPYERWNVVPNDTLDNTNTSDLDILSSPEVMAILESNHSTLESGKNNNSFVVPPAEAHIDNGYSSDGDFTQEASFDGEDY
jgi:hypothetical protein